MNRLGRLEFASVQDRCFRFHRCPLDCGVERLLRYFTTLLLERWIMGRPEVGGKSMKVSHKHLHTISCPCLNDMSEHDSIRFRQAIRVLTTKLR